MNERDFWEIISQARSAAANTEDVPKWIESHLETRSMGEILDFAAWLTTCLKRANDERLRRAAGKLFRRTGPLADDLWLYFRCWLVARGKEAFDLALRDPACLDSLQPCYGGVDGPRPWLDQMLYVIVKPFKATSGGKPPAKYQEVLPNWTPPPGTDLTGPLE